jgi:predicted ArsR family transcriptional regulator
LALVLWDEVMRTVDDAKIRRELFVRITDRLADSYNAQVRGEEWSSRLVQLGGLLHDRGVETEITSNENGQTVLKQLSCPYFELAEVDRDICALERRMFEKVVGHGLTLSHCRLDGDRSCDFQPELKEEPN